MRTTLYAVLVASALALAGPASAATQHYMATLNGESETPPNTTSGSGSASVDLDTATNTLSWTINYKGLTGPATGAHFHGPAPTGKAAGVAVPITGDLASPIKGSAKVTATQIKDLKAGQLYVNIHTAAHPDGEIRGQLGPAH
jgi:hypothetical protein